MSEKELGKKWDRCLADGAVKIGAGLGLGIVFSVVFFKSKSPPRACHWATISVAQWQAWVGLYQQPTSGRTWPISFGVGTGLGMAASNCQNDLRSHYALHGGVKEQ